MGQFLEYLTEAGPRIKKVRIRFRHGKIQRNIRVSNVKGFRMAHGRLVRMSAQEKLHRKRGARKAKVKRRAEKSRSRMKRMRTMRRRNAMLGHR